jgi:hypothetical protein
MLQEIWVLGFGYGMNMIGYDQQSARIPKGDSDDRDTAACAHVRNGGWQ